MNRLVRAPAFLVAFMMSMPLARMAEASEPARHGKAIKSFRRFAEQRIERDPVPGLSIGFMFGADTWADGFGLADLENEVPAKDVSAYRLASVTKPMTAIGILHLMEEGALDLDAEVQTYVPYFPRKPWPVRVRQLLGHVGGISHYRDFDSELHFKEHMDTRQAIAVFEDFDLVAEPGTRYNYSSYGYNLLGAVIEGAAGEPYGEFMRRILWEPLGMHDTRMDDPYVIIPNRVRGYRPGPDGDVIPSEFVDMSSRFAAGGTRSTVVDLLHLAEGLRDGRVLSPESVDLMWTPMVTRDGRDTGYGMGWQVRSVNGRFAVRHTGGQAETRTVFIYIPARELALAAAVNYEGGGWAPYVERLYTLLTNEGYNQPIYARDASDQRVLDTIQPVFDVGMRHYDRHGRAFTDADARLDAAFDSLRAILANAVTGVEPAATLAKLHRAMHPASGSTLPIVGSYLAAVIVRDGTDLDAVHAAGAVELFARYVDAYRSSAAVPASRRFDAEFERNIGALREDWRRNWTTDTRLATWPTYGELREIEPLLRKLERRFAGTRVYPDFSRELSQCVVQRIVAEDAEGARNVADWARAHYSNHAGTLVDAAAARLARGDETEAHTLIAQAVERAPEGAGSARGLNRRAYALRQSGALDTSLRLLEAAHRVHPDDANLCDSIGEFHLAAGRQEQAILWYEKALERDPEFASALAALERLRADTAQRR